MSRRRGDPAIDALSEFERHERNSCPHKFEESFIELLARLLQDAHPCLDAVAFEGFYTFACDHGVGIWRSDDDSFRFGGSDAFYTGGRFPVMDAGFKVNIHSRALDWL